MSPLVHPSFCCNLPTSFKTTQHRLCFKLSYSLIQVQIMIDCLEARVLQDVFGTSLHVS